MKLTFRSSPTRLFAAALVLPMWVACGAPALTQEAVDSREDAFFVEGKEDAYGVREGSAEACGILKLASEGTREQLDGEARLDRRAVDNIIAYRNGKDGVAGTHDDERFDSFAELDAVSYVGSVAFGKLTKYVRARALSCRTLDLKVLALADIHGQLDPVAVTNVGNVGGAALLEAHFRNERVANPYTAVVSAGDLFGASPPLSMYFREKPMIETANALRVVANAAGNHEFDRGPAHLKEMIQAARFPFVAANLAGVSATMTCAGKPSSRCIEPYTIVQMGGVKVAFIGLSTPETPTLVKAGSLGQITITDPLTAARSARISAASKGARVFVLLAHIGGAAAPATGGEPSGPIMELAKNLTGFDAIVGGHTHTAISAVVNGVPVIENKSQSQTYSRITLKYNFAQRAVTERTATIETPGPTVTPAQSMIDLLAPYRTELAAAFDVPVGIASAIFERDGTLERTREVGLGNLVADSIRLHTGTQLGFVNGGGLRAPIPSTYQPTDHTLRRTTMGYAAGAPFDLVLGDVFAVLPFGNAIATQTVTGAQLWQMLEHAVDALPGAKGYFAQISGFRFTYDAAKPIGSRVVSVALDNGRSIAKDTTQYTMTTSDFIAAGGDGYTVLAGVPAATGDSMADILRDHIKALRTIAPATSGRISAVTAP